MCGITAVEALNDGFRDGLRDGFGTFLFSSGFWVLFGILEGKRFGSAAGSSRLGRHCLSEQADSSRLGGSD